MKKIDPLTITLTVILVIIVASGIMFFLRFSWQSNQAKEQTRLVNASKKAENISSQDLASLENKDVGYTVKYPTNFDAMYTQDGVEFTPKNEQGKIILQVKNQIVNVNIEQDQVEQTQLGMLNDAAQIIKNTFQFTQPVSTEKPSNEGRFSNIRFDPKKY